MSLLPEQRALTSLHTIALAVQQMDGIAHEQLLQDSGVSSKDLQTPEKLITHAQELRVFANALSCANDPALGLSLGLRMHVSAYGLLGYSMLASQTLRDALQLAFAHPALLGTYFQLSLQEDQGTARIVARGYRYAPELTVFNTELCLASMLTVIRDLLGEPIQPTELLLPYRQPLHAQMYYEKLGCPVEFAAPVCALAFDARLLERLLPLADPVSCHNGLQQCLKLESQLNSGHDLLELIRQYLTRHLRGDGSLDAVAAYLNRSPRSLRRHLQELHTSYQQLLDEVRFEKARQMLQQTDLPIYLIAEQLGYSETASFRSAFVRWSGLTPSRYRH